ncbi:(2R)-3-sulfolactate dehydrogenase (NADP+) [Advenella incenata]|jgi:(2R)-3-sulfolactate dehydrogenase (NADP+)|uniref:(2R)-3-sulfolactate dehydrogenase (NADP+) n=1 Tax=Advenella incenata TaxID=267800 RepID=A0A4Q7VDK9_9BURK|nr:Ldh family oxidoreductase [Advenella incenata]RZT94077.1 (2R)-3-sulfolactate dehydrogenase (NADP+) [Advenella incenata]
MSTISLSSLITLAQDTLAAAGANPAMAETTAKALVFADAHGIATHGVSRVPSYALHLSSGRADGGAEPEIVQEKASALLVDARTGLAFPACELAITTAIEKAKQTGICIAGVTNSHHFGMAAYHLEPVAHAGLIGLAFSNSPSAITAWGGKRPLFGTNPIAAAFPREQAEPVVIDLSLSQVARGKVILAARDDKPIPDGWALDSEGRPTNDAKAALKGSMQAAGGVKGSMLALMVEVLCVALTGANFGYEADPLYDDTGNEPRLGQVFILIDPQALAGQQTYFNRLEDLIAAMLEDDGVRLPGARRHDLANTAQEEGITVPDSLLAQMGYQ